MSDREVLVRHIGGETVYDTTTFATEDKTGVLLIYSDASQKQVIAAYNPQGWIAAEVVDKVVNDDGTSPD
ncbi:hypothetical protein KKP62_10190 [Rhodococcus sp. GOMB7]|uniref:hypothetical protein n=1 Tax=Rhodococcus sp. GOMB7 TaxID=2839033 RepID=UPI001C006011|nr:hypothetical protein [Rhodococcus sp. GOMB7]MBT9295332.1 hypothetical protein [Rhodococcus sp. GOMB7]